MDTLSSSAASAVLDVFPVPESIGLPSDDITDGVPGAVGVACVEPGPCDWLVQEQLNPPVGAPSLTR